MASSRPITVRFPSQMLEKLDAYVTARGWNRAQGIVYAVESLLSPQDEDLDFEFGSTP
jgi:metal-responsive CopG/Arc/MetJ family transcriptional regulator